MKPAQYNPFPHAHESNMQSLSLAIECVEFCVIMCIKCMLQLYFYSMHGTDAFGRLVPVCDHTHDECNVCILLCVCVSVCVDTVSYIYQCVSVRVCKLLLLMMRAHNRIVCIANVYALTHPLIQKFVYKQYCTMYMLCVHISCRYRLDDAIIFPTSFPNCKC